MPLTGDVTVVCPLAYSYVATAAGEAGSVAELAPDLKSIKYTDFDSRYSFKHSAIETLGQINDSAREFLFNMCRKISLQSSDDRDGSFWFSKSLSDLMLFCYMTALPRRMTNGLSSFFA